MPRNRPSDSGTEQADGLFGTGRPGELHQRVHRSLLHAIISGRFAAGSRLPSEPDLAATFSVSRPVVRQAIDRLKTLELVVSQRGSGNYVAPLDPAAIARFVNPDEADQHLRQMSDDLELRLAVEPEAALLAAHRHGPEDLDRMEQAIDHFQAALAAGRITHHADYLFHLAIARATGNDQFLRTAEMLEFSRGEGWLLIRHLAHFQPATRADEVMQEHRRVLDWIRRRDGEAARRSMIDHLEASRLRLAGHVPTGRAERASQGAPPDAERA